MEGRGGERKGEGRKGGMGGKGTLSPLNPKLKLSALPIANHC